MDVGTVVWDAACEIRGPLDAPKFKDYILPLVFLKRLSDVFDDELAWLTDEFGSAEAAVQLVEAGEARRIPSCGFQEIEELMTDIFFPTVAPQNTITADNTGVSVACDLGKRPIAHCSTPASYESAALT